MAEAAGVWRKGPWTPQEDNLLIQYITQNGEGRWSSVSKCTGLKRSGKSCRLRWVNYLRPGLKKGQLTPQEEGIIIELHAIWGNKWSTIARYLPGRTDNEIKNYWRTHFKPSSTFKKQKAKILNHKHQLQQSQTQSQSQSQSQSLADGNNNYIESPHSHSSSEAEAEAEAAFNSNEFWSTIYEESGASDFIPTDCYLWGGLWNLDGIDDLCSQMPVAPQQPNYHPFEGDAVDYVQSADFLL